MQLSLIIVSWNTAPITLKCIQSINKFIKKDYEIILADNHSSDNTVSLARKQPHVKVIVNSDNLGFSKANNIAARKAKGEYFLFLNSDIEVINDSLLKMLQFLKDNPQIGVIGPQFLNPDLSPQASVFPPQTPLNAFRQFWLNLPCYSKCIPNEAGPVWSVSGGAILIPKKLFQKIGGWDEKYFFYFEDLELCRQVHRLGKLVYYYPQAKVIHHHGASGRSLASTQKQWRRLIPSSKKYHGPVLHYLINFIIWSGQKWHSLFSR